jgi:S1-C subfamily serine protease
MRHDTEPGAAGSGSQEGGASGAPPAASEPTATTCPDAAGGGLGPPGDPTATTVDLELLRAPREPRAAYAAARSLAAAGHAFSEVRRALDAGHGRLLAAVSPETAQAALRLLEDHGGEGRIVAAAAAVPAPAAAIPVSREEDRRASSAVPRRLALAAGVALALLAAWRLARPTAEEAVAASPRPAVAATEPALSPREIGARARQATALVRRGNSLGSGFFVQPELLVTAAHVLASAAPAIEITLASGEVHSGVLEREDRWLDVALVRVPGAAAQALTLGDAAVLAQGDAVYFYGNPQGLEFTLGQALVSHAARNVQGLSYLQLDGNIHPGNSGGPLLDPRAAVVGVVTMRVGDDAGLGLALPVNYLYTPTDATPGLLPAPGEIDHSAWQAFLARAADANRKAVAETLAQQQLPMLASALLRADGVLLAIVLRQSPSTPGVESLQFSLSLPSQHGGGHGCSPWASARDWRQVASADDLDERTRLWLERNQLSGDTWATMVALDASACPPPDQLIGGVLELPVAPPAGRRADITLLDPMQSMLLGAGGP